MIQTNIRRATSGYSLLETILVIGLSTLVFIGLFGLYEAYGKFYTLQDAQLSAARSVRQVVTEISGFIAEANRVALSHTVDANTYQSGPETLVLQVPALGASGAVLPDQWDYIIYYRVSSTVYRLVSPAVGSIRPPGATAVDTTIASLTFTYDNADFDQVKTVGLTVAARAVKKFVTISSTSTVTTLLRNY